MGVWIWVIDTECRLCERTAPMQAVGFFTEIVQEIVQEIVREIVLEIVQEIVQEIVWEFIQEIVL